VSQLLASVASCGPGSTKMQFRTFVWCDNVRNNSRAGVPFQFSNFAGLKWGTAMKSTFTLKNMARSILVASVIMFAVAGAVHAQGSTAKKSGSSASSPGSYTYGKDAARDYAVSQGSGSHIYGKDQSADYAKSQESGSYSYGKDSSSDYSRSQGSSSSPGRATGMGSSSSQGSSTSGTSSGSGGY
jgi:hypothetical protein